MMLIILLLIFPLLLLLLLPLLLLFLLLLLLLLLLPALQSFANLSLFQNCPSLFSDLLITSPVPNAHLLQSFLN
jgi:hypothetical protein